MKKKFNKKKQTRAGEKAEKKRSKELDGEYSSVKSLSSSDKKLIAVVAVLIIVLLVKPAGLLGKNIQEKV